MSCPPEFAASDPFWDFWWDALQRLRYKRNHSELEPGADVFFGPKLPEIREALFRMLPAAITEGDDVRHVARRAWANLTEVDPVATMEFLQIQVPSPQLCYALGSSDMIFRLELDISWMGRMILELYDSSRDILPSNSSFTMALLFAFCHAGPLLKSQQPLRAAFSELISLCLLDNDPEIASAAARSLNYISKNLIEQSAATCISILSVSVENRTLFAISIHTGFLFSLFFNPEDGGDMFLRNVGLLSMDYTALYPTRYKS
jgi:hypothetical protein